MIPRSVCMLFLWVGVGLGTECPVAGGVACENNIGGFCNSTQRDCIGDREQALVSLVVNCTMRAYYHYTMESTIQPELVL